MTWLRAFAAALAVLGSIAMAAAEDVADYPSRPIRIIVPAAAGGGSDILARGVGQALTQVWPGAQVIVENRGGASNQLGAEVVIKSPPDGYTLLLTAEATVVINQWLYKNLPYDPVKDFTPITGLVEISQGLVISNGLGPNTVAEFLALAKAKPAAISFGNFGIGSTGHLNMETLQHLTGTRFIAVPYKGATPAINDILGGHLDAMFIGVGTALNFSKPGKVKLIAVGTKQRLPEYPDIPTIAETVPGFTARSWFGLIGPADMPKPIVHKLATAVAKVFEDKEFQEKILKPNFYQPIVSSPEDFVNYIKTDAQAWKAVIETANVKIE